MANFSKTAFIQGKAAVKFCIFWRV